MEGPAPEPIFPGNGLHPAHSRGHRVAGSQRMRGTYLLQILRASLRSFPAHWRLRRCDDRRWSRLDPGGRHCRRDTASSGWSVSATIGDRRAGFFVAEDCVASRKSSPAMPAQPSRPCPPARRSRACSAIRSAGGAGRRPIAPAASILGSVQFWWCASCCFATDGVGAAFATPSWSPSSFWSAARSMPGRKAGTRLRTCSTTVSSLADRLSAHGVDRETYQEAGSRMAAYADSTVSMLKGGLPQCQRHRFFSSLSIAILAVFLGLGHLKLIVGLLRHAL